MKVREIMTADVGTCRPETNLAEAVKLMWEKDCGALPGGEIRRKARRNHHRSRHLRCARNQRTNRRPRLGG